MLPGTWAYVSAGAFGRAIIVSLYFFCPKLFCMLDVLAIQSLLELFGPSLTSYTFSPSLHPFYVCFVIEI